MQNTPEENAALVRRFLTDVVAGGDTAAADVLLAEESVDHNLVFGAQGRDGMTTLGWRVLAGADVDIEIDRVVATHERVAVRATVTGRHTESLMELAPTGVSFEIDYAWFFRLHDGRIAEIRSLPDGLELLRQLGALPDQPATRSHTDQDSHSE